jgi:hypothetical protein
VQSFKDFKTFGFERIGDSKNLQVLLEKFDKNRLNQISLKNQKNTVPNFYAFIVLQFNLSGFYWSTGANTHYIPTASYGGIKKE